MRGKFATCLILAALAAATLLQAAPAQASFHLMKVTEVAPNPAGVNSSFIELQMYADGQNLVGTHKVDSYTSTGMPLGTFTIPSNVANGGNQRTILLGDTATPGGPDFVDPNFADYLSTIGAGGAVCYENIDCVSWGGFTGAASLPSPSGNPAAAIPSGSSLSRSIATNCATLLETTDDTNNSLADFSIGTPSPRNNAVTPTGTECKPGAGVGGDPNTKIKKRPKNRSDDISPTFKFKADEPGATFKCKLDKKKFKKCKSPKTYHGLDPGKHKFKVEAIDSDGNVDPTPAKDKFKVLP